MFLLILEIIVCVWTSVARMSLYTKDCDRGFRYLDMAKGISQLIKLKLKPSMVQLLVTIAAICDMRLIFSWYKCDYGSLPFVIYSVMTVGSCYKYCLLHHMFSSNPCLEVTLWRNYYIIMLFGCSLQTRLSAMEYGFLKGYTLVPWFSTFSTCSFFNLPHPAVFFQPPAPRNFFNLPHPAVFQPPTPRKLVTPHPAN